MRLEVTAKYSLRSYADDSQQSSDAHNFLELSLKGPRAREESI